MQEIIAPKVLMEDLGRILLLNEAVLDCSLRGFHLLLRRMADPGLYFYRVKLP